MSLPLICNNANEIPNKLSLHATKNERVFTIDPPLRLVSAQHYTQFSTLRTRSFYPMKMEDDQNLAQMLEKVRSQLGQCLWVITVGNMAIGVEVQKILSKAITSKQPLVRTPITQEGMLWLQPTRCTKATEWHSNSPIRMNSIGAGQFQFLIMVNQIYISEERAVLQPRIDEFKYLPSYAIKREELTGTDSGTGLPGTLSVLSASWTNSLASKRAEPPSKLESKAKRTAAWVESIPTSKAHKSTSSPLPVNSTSSKSTQKAHQSTSPPTPLVSYSISPNVSQLTDWSLHSGYAH